MTTRHEKELRSLNKILFKAGVYFPDMKDVSALSSKLYGSENEICGSENIDDIHGWMVDLRNAHYSTPRLIGPNALLPSVEEKERCEDLSKHCKKLEKILNLAISVKTSPLRTLIYPVADVLNKQPQGADRNLPLHENEEILWEAFLARISKDISLLATVADDKVGKATRKNAQYPFYELIQLIFIRVQGFVWGKSEVKTNPLDLYEPSQAQIVRLVEEIFNLYFPDEKLNPDAIDRVCSNAGGKSRSVA